MGKGENGLEVLIDSCLRASASKRKNIVNPSAILVVALTINVPCL